DDGLPFQKYFAHTRVEDLPPSDFAKTGQKFAGDTRRVIELQSDLFQKGRLDTEKIPHGAEYGAALREAHDRGFTGDEANKLATKWVSETKDLSKLEPYRNTWWQRIVREEVKQAAKDGKTKLQFPTGETAMKIEGLGGGENRWTLFHGNQHPLQPSE